MLRECVHRRRRAAHRVCAYDAAMAQQLFVDVIKDADALRGNMVDRRNHAIEHFASGALIACLELSSNFYEGFGLSAKRHRPLRTAPHLLDEISAASAAKDDEAVASQRDGVGDLCRHGQALHFDVADALA